MSINLPENPVGKFLAIFQPIKPRTLLYVERVIYKITGVKGTKQLLLETVYVPDGEEDKPRSYTVIGDNIAMISDTLEQAQAFLRLCASVVTQYAITESQALRQFEAFCNPVPAALSAAVVSTPRRRPPTPLKASSNEAATSTEPEETTVRREGGTKLYVKDGQVVARTRTRVVIPKAD